MRSIQVTTEDKGLLSALLSYPAEGMDIAELRSTLKTLDRIERSSDQLRLEEAEYDLIMKRYKTAKFVKVERGIVELYDKLSTAESM
jgi:hypothetical protein